MGWLQNSLLWLRLQNLPKIWIVILYITGHFSHRKRRKKVEYLWNRYLDKMDW
jgi:hypothetical protein